MEGVLPGKKSFFRKVLALLRFSVFYSLLVATIFATFPLEKYLVFESYYLFIAIGGILLLLIAGIFFMFPGASPGSKVGFVFDLEAIGAVVVGMIVTIVLGAVTLTTFTSPGPVMIGLTLMGIYSFYVYRIIKEAFRVHIENEEIRRQYGELLEIDKEKNNFIMVTSHQLRTPLTEIRWSLETVMLKSLEKEVYQTIQRSVISINKLVAIVNDMLSAGIVDAKLEKNMMSLVPAIEEIMQELQPLIHQKQVALSFNPPPQDIQIHADREKIKLAIRHVVDNAIRYAPQKTVRIYVTNEPNAVIVKVEDDGIGIIPEDYDRVFKKFFRGKNALLVEPDGSGMGLYTANLILQKHDGKIHFVSTPGKNTVFVLTIPKK